MPNVLTFKRNVKILRINAFQAALIQYTYENKTKIEGRLRCKF